jgi:hypothetical protein
MLNKLIRTHQVLSYLLSTERKQLNHYMNRIRRMETLSDSETTKLKTLMENEIRIYEPYRNI